MDLDDLNTSLLVPTDKWYRFLLKRAKNHYHRKTRLVAVLVSGGSVLSVGFNTDSNHAEISAIKLAKNPEGSKLYVLRLRKDGVVGIAKPCLNCQKVIKQNQIHRVFHT